jgi:hypothetical protein
VLDQRAVCCPFLPAVVFRRCRFRTRRLVLWVIHPRSKPPHAERESSQQRDRRSEPEPRSQPPRAAQHRPRSSAQKGKPAHALHCRQSRATTVTRSMMRLTGAMPPRAILALLIVAALWSFNALTAVTAVTSLPVDRSALTWVPLSARRTMHAQNGTAAMCGDGSTATVLRRMDSSWLQCTGLGYQSHQACRRRKPSSSLCCRSTGCL